MPIYKRGTAQWAEQRLAELRTIQTLSGLNAVEVEEFDSLTARLAAGCLVDDLNPKYTTLELEEAGQGGLEL